MRCCSYAIDQSDGEKTLSQGLGKIANMGNFLPINAALPKASLY
jgi:hypothetical protein